jgi:hypothetical protein
LLEIFNQARNSLHHQISHFGQIYINTLLSLINQIYFCHENNILIKRENNMKSLKLFFILTTILLVTFTACQQDDFLNESSTPSTTTLKSISVQGSINPAAVASVILYAGQTTNAGSLVLNEVDTNADGINDALSATYTLTGGWLLSEIHFWIGTSLATMPQTKTGNPQVGKFPYSPTDAAGKSTYTLLIPFGAINYTTCQANYLVAAHAAVYLGSRTETAWAAGNPMNIKGSWATYFNVTLIDNNAPVISGSLSDVTLEGCSPSDAPAAVTSVNQLEALGLAIADTRTTDNNLLVTSTDVVSGSCPIEIRREYTITDACGNSSKIAQRISIDDTTAPVVTGQGADVSIVSPALPVFTAPTATDNCGGEVNFTSNDVSTTSGTSTIITRTWTATDACGNSSSVSQAITITTNSNTGGGDDDDNNDEQGTVCTSWQSETAFGGNTPGSGNAWWFSYDGVGVETIYAGQNYNAGTVELNNGYLYITLANGWELQNVSQPVKIQGYTTLPSSRPAAGQFTTYKGTSLTVAVGSYSNFVIHLDVRKCNSNN